jgi:hypothetical protein
MLAITLIVSVGFAAASEVSQGKCISYDAAKKVIVMEEYDTQFSKENPYGKPTGTESTYNVADAEMGAKPEPGHILRFAYKVKGTEKVAIKMMNVTKTNLMKK